MTPAEQQAVIDRYNERLKELGTTAQALGWRDEAQQRLRFRILTEIADCSGASVLDVGCGFGDLLDYLRAKGQPPASYTGTDLNPALLDIARERHPEASFHTAGDLSGFADDSHDFLFVSGLFNFRIEDNVGFLQTLIRDCYRVARRGVAFNCLGSFVDYQDEHLYYHREQDVFAFGKSLTRFVTLRADYPLYEFTVYLFKHCTIPRS